MVLDIRIYTSNPCQCSDDETLDKITDNVKSECLKFAVQKEYRYSESKWKINMMRHNSVLAETFPHVTFASEEFLRTTIRKLNIELDELWTKDENETNFTEHNKLKELQEAIMFCHSLFREYLDHWISYSP
jgi:glucan phosphorylase